MAAEAERRERAAKAEIANERWRREQEKKAPARLHPASAAPASTPGRGAKLPGGSARRAPRGLGFPDAPTDRGLDYAKRRTEIGRLKPGQIVRILMETRAWAEIMAPILAQLELERNKALDGENRRRGRTHMWSAEQLEMIELLRRVLGLRSCKETLAWLSSPEARLPRKDLGLDGSEPHKGGRKRADGERSEKLASVPCEGTMSTWRRKWFPEKLRAALWTLVCERLLEELLETVPEKQAELDVLYLDGSHLLIHGTAPKVGKKSRAVNNTNSVTAPEAGYRADKGSGWNIDFITTAKGTVVGFEIFKLHESERDNARKLVDRLRDIFKLAGPPKLRVLCADAAFNSDGLREDLRGVGVLENIHLSSHGNNATAKESVAKRDEKRFAIEGHPNWTADGHRHLHCACDEGTTTRILGLGKGGRVVARLKGKCDNCGPIMITSGRWRKAKNPRSDHRRQTAPPLRDAGGSRVTVRLITTPGAIAATEVFRDVAAESSRRVAEP